MARKQIIALCLFAAFLFPATAFAQVDPNALTQTEREKLGQLFTRAQQAFESEEYARAVAALESAYAIFPEPNILFRIGQAHEKSKQQALAIAYYKRYLKLKPQASDRELVEARIVGMQSLIDGRKPTKAIQTTLYIDSVPDNARVEFNNDGAVGRTPLLIEIKPGTYRVDITKDGYLPGTKEITVGAGEGLRVSLELSETPSTLPDSTW